MLMQRCAAGYSIVYKINRLLKVYSWLNARVDKLVRVILHIHPIQERLLLKNDKTQNITHETHRQ